MAKIFADNIKTGGYKLLSDHFFDTVTIKTGDKTNSIYEAALNEKINLRKVDQEHLSVAFDEAKKLNDVKISFDNPKKLINFIIDNKLEKKTIPKKRNLIINSFINHTCRIDRNWYIHWSKFFNSLS